MAKLFNPVSRHRQRCREVREAMSDYIDGGLDPDTARRVRRHVRWCPNCRRILENLIRTVGGLRLLGERVSAGDDLNAET
ncbi:MAG: zf-HC2 domain-containing protein [Solirubrobacteraceae bacterium]